MISPKVLIMSVGGLAAGGAAWFFTRERKTTTPEPEQATPQPTYFGRASGNIDSAYGGGFGDTGRFLPVPNLPTDDERCWLPEGCSNPPNLTGIIPIDSGDPTKNPDMTHFSPDGLIEYNLNMN